MEVVVEKEEEKEVERVVLLSPQSGPSAEELERRWTGVGNQSPGSCILARAPRAFEAHTFASPEDGKRHLSGGPTQNIAAAPLGPQTSDGSGGYFYEICGAPIGAASAAAAAAAGDALGDASSAAAAAAAAATTTSGAARLSAPNSAPRKPGAPPAQTRHAGKTVPPPANAPPAASPPKPSAQASKGGPSSAGPRPVKSRAQNQPPRESRPQPPSSTASASASAPRKPTLAPAAAAPAAPAERHAAAGRGAGAGGTGGGRKAAAGGAVKMRRPTARV